MDQSGPLLCSGHEPLPRAGQWFLCVRAVPSCCCGRECMSKPALQRLLARCKSLHAQLSTCHNTVLADCQAARCAPSLGAARQGQVQPQRRKVPGAAHALPGQLPVLNADDWTAFSRGLAASSLPRAVCHTVLYHHLQHSLFSCARTVRASWRGLSVLLHPRWAASSAADQRLQPDCPGAVQQHHSHHR